MPFQFRKLEIPGIVLLEPKIYKDERGHFLEIYKRSELKEIGVDKTIAQVSQSSNKRNTLRGLHYQLNPMAQGKLVSVLRGRIFDVAVDIRKGSPTYGKWAGVNLDSKKKNMLYIPEGFAHGFYTISAVAEVLYQCTNEYSKEHERGIVWNDPSLAIAWPVNDPLVLEKENQLPLFKDADNNFIYSAS